MTVGDAEKPTPQHYWLLVHENYVQAIEIGFEPADRAGRPFGFGVVDDEPTLTRGE